jgi:pyruvate-formate lyase-activating enzyme
LEEPVSWWKRIVKLSRAWNLRDIQTGWGTNLSGLEEVLDNEEDCFLDVHVFGVHAAGCL